jgi:hypothetical protein
MCWLALEYGDANLRALVRFLSGFPWRTYNGNSPE